MGNFETEIEQAISKKQCETEEIRQIMLEKLEEMVEIRIEDCKDSYDYANICSTMHEIAKTLLGK